ncbi:MurR/RpiR family transcriptional regulator [Caballeronia sp. DA-9]|uniref:MurR/RpiR family transcriptional regulator n=1 Tax=Caballeronia sp. DA-9 TaxID=3436237 RepID=UPI003F6790C3
MQFSTAVRQHFEQLTRAQKALARHIADHSEDAAFATAKQIGEAVGQSDAAVVRFARAIGYDGFPQMRNALREGLLERVGASGMRAATEGLAVGENLKADIFNSDAALLQDTARQNSVALADRVVDRLIAARRIWITGHGTTYPLAVMLSLHLNQILGNSEVLTIGHGDIADRIRHVEADDVLIGIGYARYLPYTIDLMRIARSYGAGIVAITDKPSSPLAEIADDTFIVGRESSTFAWWSQAGTLSLINWLVALAMTRNGAKASAMLRRSDEAWRLLSHWSSADESSGAASLASQLDDRLRSPEGASQPLQANIASPIPSGIAKEQFHEVEQAPRRRAKRQ